MTRAYVTALRAQLRYARKLWPNAIDRRNCPVCVLWVNERFFSDGSWQQPTPKIFCNYHALVKKTYCCSKYRLLYYRQQRKLAEKLGAVNLRLIIAGELAVIFGNSDNQPAFSGDKKRQFHLVNLRSWWTDNKPNRIWYFSSWWKSRAHSAFRKNFTNELLQK